MIAVDTNVVVRLLVQDDPEQAERAREALDAWIADGDRCAITLTVLCELEWVLTSAYGASRSDVTAAVRALATNEVFELEAPDLVTHAVDSYVAGKGDLSDYLIGARAAHLGASTTYTFDRALTERAWFTLL